jgi:hypothetical protein
MPLVEGCSESSKVRTPNASEYRSRHSRRDAPTQVPGKAQALPPGESGLGTDRFKMERTAARDQALMRNDNRVRGVPLLNDDHVGCRERANAGQYVHRGPDPRCLTFLKRDRSNIAHPMSVVFKSADLVPHVNQGSVDIYEDLDVAHDVIYTVPRLAPDDENQAERQGTVRIRGLLT